MEFYSRWKEKAEELMGKAFRKVLDQAGHFAWACLVLLPLAIYPSWWLGFLAGVMLALPRELIDQWPVNDVRDTIVDIVFFGIGGLFAGIFGAWWRV